MAGQPRVFPRYPLFWMILGFLAAAAPAWPQETLPFDQDITQNLPAGDSTARFALSGGEGNFLEVTLSLPSRDFSLALSLFDQEGKLIETNEGQNDPQFAGAYLIVELPYSGDYVLQVDAQDVPQPVDYTLRLRALDGDEPDRLIRVEEAAEGIIGPAGDFDAFSISLREGNPVAIVAATPHGILDSIVGVFTPEGELLDYNNDFLGTGSVLYFEPYTTGEHWLVVQGSQPESVGPYTLIVHTPPLLTAPYTAADAITIPGDVLLYRMQLKETQVYDFAATGVDNFQPLVALTDQYMNVIASEVSDATIPIALIHGFTPLQDQVLYLYVMGMDNTITGDFGLDVTRVEDQQDGIELKHGDIFSGVIGPVGDRDEYRFTAEAGKRYSILVTPTEHYLDPAVQVLDSQGNILFTNDDSADGVFSILSGISLPQPGEYRVRVQASLDQTVKQRLTGVYVIQLAEGTTFDRGAPRIYEPAIQVTPLAGGVQILIPTPAIADDTYPLSATMTYDREPKSVAFEVKKDQPVQQELDAQPDEIFFLTATDSAESRNTSLPVTLPAPRVVITLGGDPLGLAVDTNNNLYVTDSLAGTVVRITIQGATTTLVQGEAAQGGSLGPNALAFNPAGDLYLSNAATYSILKVSPNGATQTVTSDVNYPVAMIFDQDNVLYVAQIGSDTVDRVYPDGRRDTWVTGIRNPSGLAFSPSGQLYVCNSDRGNSGIYRILADGTPEVYGAPFADALEGMAFDQEGYLYVADGYQGVIYRISPAGERIVFTRGLAGPVDLAFGRGEYAKTLFATNQGIEYAGFYSQQVIAIPTGRAGLPKPFVPTGIGDWMVME
ncbi:MAG: pre-peptidase C-terminal domain-containing protein [bacterium]